MSAILSNTATPKYYGRFREAVMRGEIPICREIEMEMNRIDALIANPGVYYDALAVEGYIKYEKLYRGEKIWKGDGNSIQLLTNLGINHEMDLRANNEPVTSNESTFANQYKILASGSNKTYEIIHYGIDYNAMESKKFKVIVIAGGANNWKNNYRCTSKDQCL